MFQFGSLFDELIENLEDVLAVQHLGVVVALADGILKHNTRQKPFITVSFVSVVIKAFR